MFARLLTCLGLCAALALPAAAQDSIGTPATGEILTGWQQPDGSRIAAIRIRLAPGWKTYWRSPGDAGIPPSFDWSGSRNLRGVGIIWPAPRVIAQNGMRTIGYRDELVLPLTIAAKAPDQPVTLHAAVDLGVCSDICVPYQLTVEGTLDNTGHTPTPMIAAALAARPYSAQEAGVTAATCALRPKGDGFEIVTRLTLPRVGRAEVVVIEPGRPNLWISETDNHRAGGVLTATGDLVATDGGALALDRSAITMTVLAGGAAVEIKGCTPG